MSVKSILSNIGHGIAKFFTGAVKIAEVAEPFIAVAFPGISELYIATVNEVAHAETLALAANVQNGTGPQKLALAVAAITPTFLDYAKTQGINVSGDTISKWVSAVVATLNNIPAPNASVPPTSAVAPVTGAAV